MDAYRENIQRGSNCVAAQECVIGAAKSLLGRQGQRIGLINED